MTEEKKAYVEEILQTELSSLVDDHCNRTEIIDNVIDEVCEDIDDAAESEFNDSDIRMAFGRVLAKVTGLGK